MATNSQQNATCYYVIARQHEKNITWPIISTTAGNAVAVFTDAEQADVFRNKRGLSPDWFIGAMEARDFLHWLRCNLLNGVYKLLVNPSAEGAEGRALGIFQVLVEAG